MDQRLRIQNRRTIGKGAIAAKTTSGKSTSRQPKATQKSVSALSPEEILLLDQSFLDYVDWSDFSEFNHEQLIALGQLAQQGEGESPYCFTIPPFIIGPLPQKASLENHFSRKFRWQEIHYSSSIGSPLPAGSAARLLLLHIVTSVTQTRSPYVDFKSSITKFMRDFGFTPTYGAKGSVVKFESAMKSLLHTIVELRTKRTDEQGNTLMEEVRFPIFQRDALTLNDKGLVDGKAVVDAAFVNLILASNVILDRKAVATLAKSRSPAALDIYTWATYTNFYLGQNPRPFIKLSWEEAHALFSSSDIPLKSFKRDFPVKVKLVESVYPKLRLVVTPEALTLWQSPPHILPIPNRSRAE